MNVLAWLVVPLVLAFEPPLPDPPVFPGGVIVSSEEPLEVAGQPARIAYFRSSEDLRTIVRHFLKRWRDAGLPALVEGSAPGPMVVTAFEVQRRLVHVVVLKTRGGDTVGFGSVVRLQERVRGAPTDLTLEGVGTALGAPELFDGGSP